LNHKNDSLKKPRSSKNAVRSNYFRYRQKDVEYAEIDLLNMVQKIGGIDQLADDRSNIGL